MVSIHPSAVVGDGAELGADVEVGPYCVLGPHVKVGDGTRLMSHVVIDGCTTIGGGCTLFPFACVGTQTQDLKFTGGRTFVEIGSNTTLREYVTVNSGTDEGEVTRVGSGCHIMAYAHIAHACMIGNGVIMSNATNLAGHITVEDGVVFGGVSGVHQFVRIGTMCMVGGMSRIVRDCPPYMMVAGAPPSVSGLNSVGLKRRNVPEDIQKRLKEAYKILYRRGLNVSQALEAIEAEIEPCDELLHLVAFIRSSERGIVR